MRLTELISFQREQIGWVADVAHGAELAGGACPPRKHEDGASGGQFKRGNRVEAIYTELLVPFVILFRAPPPPM